MTEHSQRDFPQVSKVTLDRPTIQAVARLIAERFDPEQIILFGSHARGNAGSHSDIDLLVVLVTTHDRLAKQRNNPYSFVNTALESQETLYERSSS